MGDPKVSQSVCPQSVRPQSVRYSFCTFRLPHKPKCSILALSGERHEKHSHLAENISFEDVLMKKIFHDVTLFYPFSTANSLNLNNQ